MSIIGIKSIGEWFKKNQADIALVIGFILVALIAFGAGRLSAPQIARNPITIEEPNSTTTLNLYGNISQPLGGQAEESVSQSPKINGKGLFVASKNGKKYYWPWSGRVKRIKPENLIWFKSESEAQKAGYEPSSDFQQTAPAGYKSQ